MIAFEELEVGRFKFHRVGLNCRWICRFQFPRVGYKLAVAGSRDMYAATFQSLIGRFGVDFALGFREFPMGLALRNA